MDFLDSFADRHGDFPAVVLMSSILTLVILFPLVYYANKNEHQNVTLTQEAAKHWASSHLGALESCSKFNQQRLCRVRTPAGRVALFYVPGETVPVLSLRMAE